MLDRLVSRFNALTLTFFVLVFDGDTHFARNLDTVILLSYNATCPRGDLLRISDKFLVHDRVEIRVSMSCG